MIMRRRTMLTLAIGMAACHTVGLAQASVVVEIEMKGTPRGERIWFDPIGVAVSPGTRIRFVNRDPGNSHTATAYHPASMGRVRRIPEGAASWNSGFLLPGQTFEVTLTVAGVYDYFCIPHELAAMAGRIVVGSPQDPGWRGTSPEFDELSRQATRNLPLVEDILRRKKVSPHEVPTQASHGAHR
jgi:plastocyanin